MSDQRGVILDGRGLSVHVDPLGARIRSVRSKIPSVELLAAGATDDAPAPQTDGEWMQRFASGWNVLLPHAGDARLVDGVVHAFHGEAARRVWRVERISAASLSACLNLRTLPLGLTRTVAIEGNDLVVTQRIENLSPRPQRFGWVEHPAFAGTLFDGLDSVQLGEVSVAVARHGQKSFDSAAVGSGRIDLALQRAGLRLELSWDPTVLPHAHVWQERESVVEAPWFGQVDAIALEPASHPSGPAEIGLGPLVLPCSAVFESSLRLRVTPIP